MNVVWHDLECGGYAEDLPLWRSLADEQGDPVLDIGAGTGRVALDLARRGHQVTALDHDGELIAELLRRAQGLPVHAVIADARRFELSQRFALCLIPMQTIQLLDGSEGRVACLRCAAGHLAADGLLAVAITDTLDFYDADSGLPVPLPDICEIDGIVYSSQPTAVRVQRERFVLERRREVVATDGARTVSHDVIELDPVSAEELERDAVQAGLEVDAQLTIPATQDYVGSRVVMLRG